MVTVHHRLPGLLWGFCLLCICHVNVVAKTIADQPNPELRSALKKAVEESKSFPDRFSAEIWLLDMSGRLERSMPDTHKRLELLKYVHREATARNLPPELVLAVIQVESNFDRFAISRVGARGLMQIMPFWLEELGRPNDNLFQVQTNLRYGCTILRFYMDKEKNDLHRALARYNGSVGRQTYSNKVLNALSKRWYRQ